MRTTITISIDSTLKEELDKKIVKGKQSKFIAESTKEMLKKMKVGDIYV